MSEALTIRDLHALLHEEMDKGNGMLPIHHAYQYGDHSRTVVAPEATEASIGTVAYSNYHNMHKVTEGFTDESDGHLALVIE